MTSARVYSSGRTPNQLLDSRTAACCFAILIALLSLSGAAQPSADQGPRAVYQKAEAAFKSNPQDEKVAWEFGRACFDLAEAAPSKTDRAKLAEQGAAACRQALLQNSNSAPAHYYLGLNLGEVASTRGLSALKLIKEMESELILAARIDEKFDHAGPERSLGMLYRDAPSFGSIGSRSKARHQLMRAVELAPHYPDNHFELIESYIKWGDGQTARAELKALENSWPEARKELSGPEWEKQWREWDAQLQKVKKRVGESSKVEPPRH